MPWTRPTLPQLTERIATDLESRLLDGGGAMRRSVVGVLARVYAGAAHLLHGFLEFMARQLFVDSSEAEFLVRQSAIWGLARVPAQFAAGQAVLYGSNGAVIPSGVDLRRADDLLYRTTADAVIAGGSATVPVRALLPGSDGNADPGAALFPLSPVAGVIRASVGSGGMVGGADEESDESLRARLLDRIRQPPHGGAAHDYAAWAREVSGVTRAWTFPGWLGDGTVGVTFVRDADPGGPIPAATSVTEVQARIDAVRPVTAEVAVFAPVPAPLAVDVRISPDTAAVRAAVEAELADLFLREAEPGATILLSHLREAVSVAAGEHDHALVSPVADTSHADNEFPLLGSVTWEA
ncbi:MAG: baseplate J/gp47 family protein [Desulfovibrionaceae bacterium]